MESLKQKYQKISQEFLKNIKKGNKVVCALITGSYFNNKLSENSDIDIFIITSDSDIAKRGVKRISNVKISFFMNSLMMVKRLLNEEKDLFKRPTAERIVFSDCIYGEELSKKLKEEASNVIKRKLPKLTKKEIYDYGWYLYDKVIVLKRDLDKIQKQFMINDLFWICTDIFFKINRTYKPHNKYVLPKIKELDSIFYEYLKEHLTGSEEAIFKMTDYLQKEMGFHQKDYSITY
ncbi:MAG: hypothetical protein PWQ87_43 [Candidatus Woesearchaeota archaeon]|nr:hypothetical protein [Candidatus Woesearchaeota archaeon]